MGSMGLAVKRARAGLGLLLTILLLAAGTTAIIASTLGYSDAAATTAARQALTGAEPTEAGIRVQTRLAPDASAQDAAAQQIIRETFAPTQVHIQRTIRSEPRPVTDHPERLIILASAALTADDPAFGDRINVVEGAWPGPSGGAVQGALHVATAQQWDVEVGDLLDVSGTPVEITAVWRPVDPAAAFWFGDPLVEAGSDGGDVGPLVVPAEAATSFGSTPLVQFSVQPDADQVLPADMPRLAAVAGTLDRMLKTPEVDVRRGVIVEGDLALTAQVAARNLTTARALNLVPITLLLLVSLIAIAAIARLQAQARAGEVELLIARGASRRQVLGWSVIEAVAVTVLASALGIAAALGIMRLVPAGELQTAIVVRTGILAGLAVLLALAVVAALQVRTLAARAATDRSGRTRTVAALGTIVLTLGAAAITWWQLSRYGSPLVSNPDGTLRTDLVAGAAPALLLAAAALLSTLLLGPLARLVETLSRGSRGLLTHLTSAQVSRRVVVYAVPVVLTVLAVGAMTLSGLYAGTSATLRANLSDLAQGADIRAVPESAPVDASTLTTGPSLDGVSGVRAQAPIWLGNPRVGGTIAGLTVLPIDQLSTVATVPPGALETAAVADALRGPGRPAAAIPLPADATSLTLDVELMVSPSEDLATAATERYQAEVDNLSSQDAFPETPDDQVQEMIRQEARREVDRRLLDPFAGEQSLSTVLWFWDDSSSAMLRVESPPVAFTFDVTVNDPPAPPEVATAPQSSSGTIEVPVTAGPGRSLVGIDVVLPQRGALYDFEVTLSGLRAGSDSPSPELLDTDGVDAWQSLAPTELPGTGSPDTGVQPTLATLGSGSGPSAEFTLHGTTGRDLGAIGRPGGGQDTASVPLRAEAPSDAAGPVPIAITTSLADTGHFEVGMPITVQAFGNTVPTQVAAIVTAVPGSTAPSGVLMDSAAISAYLASVGQTLGPPSQLWASSADPDAALEAVREAPGIASASGPTEVGVTDAAAAVRLVFWVASTGAVLLAVTGIGAVAANLLRVRRPEVPVLRALGMTPGAQARTRAAELLAVVLTSLGLGLLAGWLIGWLVVPELSASTTLAGQVDLPAPLVLEVGWWAWLLLGLVGALALLLTALYLTVRRQALDHEYREEIR